MYCGCYDHLSGSLFPQQRFVLTILPFIFPTKVQSWRAYYGYAE